MTAAGGSGATVLWTMPSGPACAPQLERWSDLLDAEERARAARFVFARHRATFIAAHALVRTVLGRWLDRAPATLRFVRDGNGRPELAGTGPSFSLSHTDGMVACAVSDAGTVGVDVEGEDTRVDRDGIADRFFAPAEARAVRGAGASAFTRIWTLKEAFLKATGEGLRRPLDSFHFALDPVALKSGGAGEAWRFAQSRPGPAHWAAVALRGSDRPLDLIHHQCAPDLLQ